MEEALSFEGETAPYMQYTYARCCSILRKYNDLNVKTNTPNYSQILGTEAFEIIKLLNNFNDVIMEVVEKYEPSILSRTLMNLCKNFNKFYHDYKVLDEDYGTMQARVNLVFAVKTALKLGLNLLGLSVVEEM